MVPPVLSSSLAGQPSGLTRLPAGAPRAAHASTRVLARAEPADSPEKSNAPASPSQRAPAAAGAEPRAGMPAVSPGVAARRPMPAGRPMPQRPSVMMGPDGQPLKVVSVEKTGDDAWAGVAAVDKGEDDLPADFGKVAKLVAGDAAALLLFAVIGRINHGEVLDVETLQTALPFMLGWFPAAALLGAYGREAQGSSVPAAAAAAAKAWAAGIPTGLVLRGLSKGYVPPTPFIVVSLVATAVLLVGWRSAIAAATPEAPNLTAAQRAAMRRDKQGNPLEFIGLLISLVKRW